MAHAAAPERGCFLVADGVGWHAREIGASRTAVEAALHRLARCGSDIGPPDMAAAFRDANLAVADLLESGGTRDAESVSLVALALGRDRAVVGQVGNCRCYRLRGGAIDRISTDHTAVEEMHPGASAEGGLDAFQMHHLNVLTRALGRSTDVEPEVRSVDLRPGDRLVLCSPEVWSRIPAEHLAATVSQAPSSEAACRQLDSEMRMASDDWCVLVVDCLETADAPRASSIT